MTKHIVTALAAAVILTACGSLPHGSALGVMPQGVSGKTSEVSGALLYLTGNYTTGSDVTILTYPQSQFVANISGLGSVWGLCSDKSGNVWVVTFSYDVYKFAHGGTTPIAHVTVPDTYLATGCAVDPVTGNLAVINYGGRYGASVDVWADGQGTPTAYATEFPPWSITYDSHGNLFIDGNTGSPSNDFRLDELPTGQSNFEQIEFNKPADWPGALSWDGKHLVVGTGGNSVKQVTYQFVVRGKKASVLKRLHFAKLAKSALIAWIQGNTIISTMGTHQSQIALWHYPNGGKAYKVLSDYRGFAVVSEAPSDKVAHERP